MSQKSVKKKNKKRFTPLFQDGVNDDGIATLLDGRRPCQCLATYHKLINNCIGCGRIICEQEGSGRCFFCGTLVCTSEEEDIIRQNSDNEKGKSLQKKLFNKSFAKDVQPEFLKKKTGTNVNLQDINLKEDQLLQAISHRNKLLNFDSDQIKNNNIIDDELDYFANAGQLKWLSPEVRKKIAEKLQKIQERRENARNVPIKIMLDLDNDQAFNMCEDEEEENFDFIDEDGVKKRVVKEKTVNIDEILQKLKFNLGKLAVKQETKKNMTQKKPKSENSSLLQSERSFTKDRGFCLSMHQPYASLLVKGIKIHEGRSWYSEHRGTIWIAAGSRKPTQEEIDQVEDFYINRGFSRDQFPESYPTGCLLGCVNVLDVLPRDLYMKNYPEGESESNFVMICEEPKEMIIKIPMKGSQRIYKLDPVIHKSGIQNLI